MKPFILISLILALVSCSDNASNNASVSNIGTGADKKILWATWGRLPAQTGMEKNIGTAGLLYGSLEDKYVVVGGGANFPYESVLNGGAKKSYSDVYMLEDVNGKMEVVEHINLENDIGYGASVTTKDGIYYIGGSTNPEADDDILFITLKDGKLNVEKIGDLPFVFQSGIAVEKDNKIYIAIGKQGDGNSNKLYE